jgi:hypothetical protein
MTRGPTSILFNEYRGSFPATKRPGHEVNHSLPSSAEFKNEWSYTSTSSISFFIIWTSKTTPSHFVYRDLHLQSDDSWCSLHPVRDRRHNSKFATQPTDIWDLKYGLRRVFLLYISSRPHVLFYGKTLPRFGYLAS